MNYILPHATGHQLAMDGALLRVDYLAGRWCATRYVDYTVTHRVFGSDTFVHEQVGRWL